MMCVCCLRRVPDNGEENHLLSFVHVLSRTLTFQVYLIEKVHGGVKEFV